ncbi:choline ABC transporter ATP-binding protein [Vibrio rumoiensis]|uniref:Choline ABC transporter ATP-binding protein n=1 Tax=Vibrio rumoiensis 1S-45 TaxID=1188252 RepID=A0A1E5E5D0_9VIBR|nr:choline ABC transporter ATP-binding protein [Vibrio rumoiensis]OEF28126.1 choline ABC transporter ATP-binding protein [Vibrio rumoiensis 1S-45]
MNSINIKNLDVVFGNNPIQALDLLDQGQSRQDIIDQTSQVVGVDDVSISVKEGEICVLMGLSGSGKSSLLRAVNGLNPISRGSLEIKDGDSHVDLANCDKATLRHLRTHRVSMVFQKFALMPWLSVLDNVAFGLEMKGMGKTERRKKAREQIEMVGLAEWADKLPHELSGGMQQRVGLARAFAMDTDILLMDEPFSALDPLIRAQLQDELLELQTKLNKTILFVSHDLDEALKIGNNIAIMESGRLIQHGTPEEIVLAPKTQYVKDFVAHTNPLNVLKGSSLMMPVSDLEFSDNEIQICPHSNIRLKKTSASLSMESLQMISEKPLTLVNWQPSSMSLEDIDDSMLITANPEISMRDAIELKNRTAHPVLMVDNNHLVGMLSDSEFYNALLGNYQALEQASDETIEPKPNAA